MFDSKCIEIAQNYELIVLLFLYETKEHEISRCKVMFLFYQLAILIL